MPKPSGLPSVPPSLRASPAPTGYLHQLSLQRLSDGSTEEGAYMDFCLCQSETVTAQTHTHSYLYLCHTPTYVSSPSASNKRPRWGSWVRHVCPDVSPSCVHVLMHTLSLSSRSTCVSWTTRWPIPTNASATLWRCMTAAGEAPASPASRWGSTSTAAAVHFSFLLF